TGGWAALTHDTGLEVTLPTSVEQHFWGKYGAGPDGKPRPYTPEEYRYAATDPPKPPADDNIPQNGAYFGVSWFFRPIEIPLSMKAKRIFLHIRGAHLRAEVYLNRKLVGYSIMEELPFECECTDAARFSENGEAAINHLAIRITNPFGRFDWVDGLNAKWGKVSLYRSHGFGALDRGITISAHQGDVRIKDLWALNSPEANRIVAFCKLRTDNHALNGDGSIRLEIIDPQTGKIVQSKAVSAANVFIGLDSPEVILQSEIAYPQAQPWELHQPRLYHLRATVADGGASTRTIAFGFRSFGPTGIDPNNP